MSDDLDATDDTVLPDRQAPSGIGTEDTRISDDGATVDSSRPVVRGPARSESPSGHERYALGRELGRGGMGSVYEAEDLQFGRTVAIKKLLRAEDPEARERFRKEAMVTGALEHFGIPSVHERAELPDGSPFYAMQRIEGRTLSDAIRGAADARARLALLPQLVKVAQTMAYAHARGVVHRDLKPDNIILGEHGEVTVIDWGLAKLGRDKAISTAPRSAPAAADLTYDGAVLGTPAYMAPEQAAGRIEAIDARTDVFGLGALLYQLLTGRAPFIASNAAEALRKAENAEYEPIESLNPEAPAQLIAVCRRALARERSDRFESAAQLAEELEAYTADAVSSVGARVADGISVAVGVVSVLVLVVAVLIASFFSGLLSLVGPQGVAIVVLAMLGSGLSIAEWLTRGRYQLSSLGLAVALATAAFGVAVYELGMVEAHQVFAAKATAATSPIEYLAQVSVASSIAGGALVLGCGLAGLQLLVWGVARRHVQTAA